MTPESGAVYTIVADRARRFGPLPFDQVVELALYHPQSGFYSNAGGPSGRSDFLTSPALGPLFGAVMARAIDGWWASLGRPEPFFVIEAGAGDGSLAAAILGTAPECLSVLRYILVERSEQLRRRQRARLPIEPAAMARGVAGGGPFVTSLAEFPAPLDSDGVVLANELLDNLPFRLLERVPDSAWAEICVNEKLTEVLVPARENISADADRLAPQAPVGARIPLQQEAAHWLRSALATFRRGRVVVIDYADTTPNMAQRPWMDWVRTYQSHGRGGSPLEHLGHQDITCEVATDQLARVRPSTTNSAQAGFLRTHGLDELADAARRAWHERASIADLEAMRARSRVNEAAALTDAAGLGAFRVLEWQVGSD